MGNVSVRSDELRDYTLSFLGKEVDQSLIDNLQTAVFELYSKHNLLVRSVLPPQDLSDGHITVEVIEFPLGNIVVQKPDDLRFSSSRAQGYLLYDQVGGLPLRIDHLDGQVSLLDQNAGISAELKVQNFENDEVNVALSLDNTSLIESSVQVDNLGSETTGRRRYSIDTQLNSLFHQGERIALGVVKTDSLITSTADLLMPVGYQGAAVSLGREWTNYKISASDLHGYSPKYWLRWMLPEIQVGSSPIKIEFGFERSDSSDDLVNTSPATPITRKSVEQLYASLNLSSTNDAGDTAYNLTIKPVLGRLDLSEIPTTLSNDELTLQSHGRFNKMVLDASVQHKFSPDLSGSILMTCQFANKNLDSSQELEVSGPSAVRAYDIGSVSGDQGCYIQSELISPITSTTALFGFYDTAYLRTHISPYAGWNTNNEQNEFSINGAGLGVRANITDFATLALTAARRVGVCSGCSDAQPSSRFWAVATVSF